MCALLSRNSGFRRFYWPGSSVFSLFSSAESLKLGRINYILRARLADIPQTDFKTSGRFARKGGNLNLSAFHEVL